MKKIAVLTVVGIFWSATIPVLAAMHYFQGFEIDIYDWSGVTRVASGTNGVTSAAGDFHAEAAYTAAPGPLLLSPALEAMTQRSRPVGIRRALTVPRRRGRQHERHALRLVIRDNKPAGTHRRDFVFNAGFYIDSDAPGPVLACNQRKQQRYAQRRLSQEQDAIRFRSPQTGWYTFEHRFYDEGLGTLAVELRITTLDGAPLHSWTLNDSTDVNGATVGGHRYGWFVIQEFPVLAIDNVSLLSVNQAGKVNACKNGGWQQSDARRRHDLHEPGRLYPMRVSLLATSV